VRADCIGRGAKFKAAARRPRFGGALGPGVGADYQDEEMTLDHIRIVLVHTSHPGNIGAVARAMKTMCLSRLYLVEPRDFPSPMATARASGAQDVLDAAVVCPDLDTALADCRLVVGASARPRSIAWPQLGPRACAAALTAAAGDGPAALVFGREAAGLTNAELDRCHYLVSIPSNPEYGSLNLAQAVQVLAYELLTSGAPQVGSLEASPAPPASTEQVSGFISHLESVLIAIGFLNPRHPRKLMRKLVRLFHRASPTQEEINILRGILTEIERSRGGELDSKTRAVARSRPRS
jgi:TrmH family RNA methyltransferase